MVRGNCPGKFLASLGVWEILSTEIWISGVIPKTSITKSFQMKVCQGELFRLNFLLEILRGAFHRGVSVEGMKFFMEGEPDSPALFKERSQIK